LAAEKRCFFCRQVGHDMSGCPRLPKKNVGSSPTPKPNVSATTPDLETKIETVDSDSDNVNTFSDTVPKDSDPLLTGVKKESSHTLPFVETKTTVNDEKVCLSTIKRKSQSHFMIPVTVCQNGKKIQAQAMIDSGATGNFVNPKFVKKNKLQKEVLVSPLSLSVVDGRPIASGKIKNNVIVSFQSSEKHVERLALYEANIGSFNIILGLPWLKKP
jgi:hypothetical protein